MLPSVRKRLPRLRVRAAPAGPADRDTSARRRRPASARPAVGARELLDAVRHPERGELAGARAELKRRLLGPDEPSSQERFDRAVRALGAAARARRLPGQRREEETGSASGTLTLSG